MLLKNLYKSIVFVIKAEYFAQTGEYILAKKYLYEKLNSEEKEIIMPALNPDIIDNYTQEQLEEGYGRLIKFCSYIIKRYN